MGKALRDWTDARYARDEIMHATWRASHVHVRSFVRHVGEEVPIDGVTEDLVLSWLESLALAPRSRNTFSATIRVFFAWAQRRGLTEEDPFVEVAKAKVPEQLPRRVPEGDVRTVLDGADFRARVMITLLVQLGVRRAELAGLRVEDWDRSAATLTVRGKEAKERLVPVEGEARDALAAWLVDGRTSGPMWPSTRNPGVGLHANRVAGIVGEAAQQVGLNITPHQYRHTMASQWVADGGSIEALRRALGHVDISTTGRYLAADVEELRPHIGARRYYRGNWGAAEPPGAALTVGPGEDFS